MAPFRLSDPCRNVTSQLILSDSGAAAATGCDGEEVVGTTSSASSVIGSSSGTLFSVVEKEDIVFLRASTDVI